VVLSPPRRVALRLGWAATLLCGLGLPLAAQEVRFHHHAGLYAPTRFSIQGGSLNIRQKIGVSFGTRMTLKFNERLDVVSGITYIPGYATISGAGRRFEVGTASHRLTASIGPTYWLVPRARKLSCELRAALGVVAGGGEGAFGNLFERSSLSGNVAAILRYQVGRILDLQMRIQQRLYRLQLSGPEPGNSSNPFRVSFGVGFPFLESIH
jgi:hypothetical protein